MRIGFDAKRAFFNRTGLGNYSRSLMAAIMNNFPENDYCLFTPKYKDNSLFLQSGLRTKPQIYMPKYSISGRWWRSFGIPKTLERLQVDVYHGLSAELPFGNKPTNIKYVVTVHDLIYERFPELYHTFDRMIYRKKTLNACQKADTIIAISEQTKCDLIQFYKIEPSKIKVVYQTCHPIFEREISSSLKAEIKEKYQLPEKFLLSVGTIEKRKNLKVVLKAMSQLSAETHLVVVGKPTAYLEELRTFINIHHLEKQIHIFHQVKFHELPAFYKLSQALIYPSVFEGFGIPIVEALKVGTPVLAATGSCLEEAGGNSSFYFSPDDDLHLAELIHTIEKDEELRQKMIKAGKLFSEKFNMIDFATETLNIYHSL